jgi:hypothetical protein
MANFRDEALYRQANFLGPVAKVNGKTSDEQ